MKHNFKTPSISDALSGKFKNQDKNIDGTTEEKISYKEQLKHPKWQRKRLEIMQRDNFKCLVCDSEEKTLHVHHLNYDAKYIWEVENKFMITLCYDCHENFHLIFDSVASDRVNRMLEIINKVQNGKSFMSPLRKADLSNLRQ